jgi:hypothetical protein
VFTLTYIPAFTMISYPTRDYSTVAEFIPFKPKPAGVKRPAKPGVTTNNQPARPRPHSLIYTDSPRSSVTSQRRTTTSSTAIAAMYKLKQEVEKQREAIVKLSERLITEDYSPPTISASPAFGITACISLAQLCLASEADTNPDYSKSIVDEATCMPTYIATKEDLSRSPSAEDHCEAISDMVALASSHTIDLLLAGPPKAPKVLVTSPTVEGLCSTAVIKTQNHVTKM